MPHDLLLCDDDIHILRAAEFKFKKAGYEVRCASDGEEGWALVQERRPDLIVTDCQMPRLDGLGLAARVREWSETADLPIVMLTAKGYELHRDGLPERLGINMVIAKPFSPRDLMQRVAELLATIPAKA